MVSRKAFLSFFIVTMTALIGDVAYRVLTTPQIFPWDTLVVLIVVSVAGLPLVIPAAQQQNQTKMLGGIIATLLIVSLGGMALRALQAYSLGQPVSVANILFEVVGRVLIAGIFAAIVLYIARRSQSKPR